MPMDELIPASQRKLSDRQKLDWLRLIRTENIGPVTFRELINHYGGADQALEALPELSRRGGKMKPLTPYPEDKAMEEWENAKKLGAELVALSEPGYPPWLAMIDTPPPLLYMKGRIEIVERPAVAIVGSRNGSAAGQKLTRQITSDLGRENFVIASGLARGIDTAAHASSIETGTIAVVAGGIDIIYPRENADLYADICHRGLAITERPPGLQPQAKDFPRRNRIVSGLAAGVLIVEAARRSGSLITARFGLEQGRDVFAVPGHPLDPRAEGTNRLLKDGATLVTSAQDIIQSLAPVLGQRQPPRPTEFGETEPYEEPPEVDASERLRVIEAMSPSPIEIDELIRTTNVKARHVQIILLELDLAGRLERHGRQLVSLVE